MRVDDTQIEIRSQPGLNPNRKRWTGSGSLPSDLPPGSPASFDTQPLSLAP